MAYFVHVFRDDLGQETEVAGPMPRKLTRVATTIGKGLRAMIRIRHPWASKSIADEHITIVVGRAGPFLVCPMPVFLNGQRVQGSHKLRDGDRIGLPNQIVVEFLESEEAL